MVCFLVDPLSELLQLIRCDSPVCYTVKQKYLTRFGVRLRYFASEHLHCRTLYRASIYHSTIYYSKLDCCSGLDAAAQTTDQIKHTIILYYYSIF